MGFNSAFKGLNSGVLAMASNATNINMATWSRDLLSSWKRSYPTAITR